MHDAKLDLNLVRALDALLAERSVTKAALKLGIGQPAMSHALGRLRDLLGDALLVRVRGSMVPTPRALALAPSVRAAIVDLERALFHPPAFDPGTSTARFVLGAADYALLVMLPKIAATLAREAPHVDLDIRPLLDAQRSLEDDEIDLAIGLVNPRESEGLFQKRLFDERFVCVVRHGHPLMSGKRTIERLIEFPHTLVAPRGATREGVVDVALAKIGRRRRVAITLPSFLVAPHLVTSTNLVAVLPERVANAHAKALGLVVFDPPFRVPGFVVHQIWHARKHHDPAHVWFRQLIARWSDAGRSTITPA